MKKDKIKERLSNWKEWLAFLKPWDLDEEVGEDLEVLEMRSSGDEQENAWKAKRLTPEEELRRKMYGVGLAAFLAVAAASGFFYYSRHHLFTSYVVTNTAESLDITGTEYVMLGNRIAKYSSDGIFCVNSKNEMAWSAAFSMQTPIVDVCENTMVIAEQQGKQVYVVNSKGLMGNFETSLPILRAKVSAQGVVTLILEDDEVTWVNMYTSSGEQIAAVKTTLEDSGYPLDAAITSDASRMMISFLGVNQNSLNSKIVFYDFSSSSDMDGDPMTGSIEYPGSVFPEVYYADASTPVALSDTGYVVFKNSKTPQEKKKVTFEKEIISSFHNEDYIGFVFNNDAEDCRFEMQLYQYSGKHVMGSDFDCDYTEIKMDDKEILLYDAKSCTVYTISGVQKFHTDYEKPVEYFAKIPGFRKYLVISNDSMDRIRISN